MLSFAVSWVVKNTYTCPATVLACHTTTVKLPTMANDDEVTLCGSAIEPHEALPAASDGTRSTTSHTTTCISNALKRKAKAAIDKTKSGWKSATSATSSSNLIYTRDDYHDSY